MNLAITLTLFRVILIPAVVVFYALPQGWSHYVSALLFLLAGLTDWLDGYIARRFKQTTRFGAFLDPVADKLLVAATLIFIVSDHGGMLLTIFAAIIICREIVISALREWMAEIGKRSGVRVAFIGKVKTCMQMIAIFIFLALKDQHAGILNMVAPICLGLSVVLTLYSMLLYLCSAWPDLTLSLDKE